MRKVLFTESQMKEILLKEGLDNGLDIGGGYLAQDDGSEDPVNASGKEVFTDPTNQTRDGEVVTGDKVSRSLNKRRSIAFGTTRYGIGPAGGVCEGIEDEKYTYSKNQKASAANTGTKMGQNIANGKNVSDGTQRKRKFDLKNQQKKLGKAEFDAKYGPIAKMVKSSLIQMSNSNKAKSNSSDLGKLNGVNDVTKTKTSVGKGHHKDGEETENGGIIHYYN